MLPTLLSVGSLLHSLPLCLVAILVDPGEEVAPVLAVWMCSPIIGQICQVCKLLPLRYLMRLKNKRGCVSLMWVLHWYKQIHAF